ncbi:MAG: hypothetical protein QW303_07945 [Nitrososphaerota archaeon]
MKHRHIFVPPFWKHNRFCLLCGRLESLTVGKNTVQLTDDKISFGAVATLNAAKQLGFNAMSRLIYHDGTNVKTVAHIDEIGGDIVKIDSLTTNLTYINNTTAERTIFEFPLTPDFTTYPNGYWVRIFPKYFRLITVANGGREPGAVGQLELRHYLTELYYDNLYFHFNTTVDVFSITDYTIRLLKLGSDYILFFCCFGSSSVSLKDIVSRSSPLDYVNGSYYVSSINTPTTIKLTAKWDSANYHLEAIFYEWQVILYGLK